MKILVPFEFTKSSEAALDFAIHHYQKFGGQIDILHILINVIPGPEATVIMPTEDEISVSKKMLDDIVTKKASEFGIDSKFIYPKVSVGSPVYGILHAEKEASYDLIIMGTHDKESLFMRILGSVSNSIIMNSNTPVMLVHGTSEIKKDITNILFVIDDETNIGPALDKFLVYNNELKAHTEFIHFAKEEDNIDQQAENILQKYYTINDLQFAFELKTIESSDPQEALQTLIDTNKYQLLVMVKGNEGFFYNYFRPSFSIKAVHQSNIPALIYKPDK